MNKRDWSLLCPGIVYYIHRLYVVTCWCCLFTDKPDKTIIDFSSDPAVLGKQVVITCVSNGRLRSRHLITHNGTRITDDPVEKEFEIFPVFWNTTGIYQCTARNKFGQNSITGCSKVVAEGKIDCDCQKDCLKQISITWVVACNTCVNSPVLFALEIVAFTYLRGKIFSLP